MAYTQAGLPYSEPTTSRDAAIAAQEFAKTQEARVLAFISGRGMLGATQKEADAALGIGRPSCAARFRGLERMGAIVKTEARMNGCTVYRAVANWTRPGGGE